MRPALNNIVSRHLIGPACRERFLQLQAEAMQALRERGVQLAGISDLKPPFEIGRPNPGFHILIYTVSGEATLHTPRRTRKLRTGQVWLGKAGGAYHYQVDRAWRMVWFHIAADSPWTFPKDDDRPVRHAPFLKLLPPVMENCVAEALLTTPYTPSIVRSYGELIGFYLERALSGPAEAGDRRHRHALQAVWEQVNANLQRDWQVADLAELLHVSQVQCHRLVERYHGTTPMGMVTRLRMQRAEELLRHTDYSLCVIADMLGYGTAYSFSRAFKRHAGISPKFFRTGRDSDAVTQKQYR